MGMLRHRYELLPRGEWRKSSFCGLFGGESSCVRRKGLPRHWCLSRGGSHSRPLCQGGRWEEKAPRDGGDRSDWNWRGVGSVHIP